jgi:hypothetical protein
MMTISPARLHGPRKEDPPVKGAHMAEFSAFIGRAIDFAMFAANRTGSAAGQHGDVARLLASCPEPEMPPELSARIETALTAEATARQSASRAGPRSDRYALLRRDDGRDAGSRPEVRRAVPAGAAVSTGAAVSAGAAVSTGAAVSAGA